jgi:hypothetical protein
MICAMSKGICTTHCVVREGEPWGRW